MFPIIPMNKQQIIEKLVSSPSCLVAGVALRTHIHCDYLAVFLLYYHLEFPASIDHEVGSEVVFGQKEEENL